MTDTENGAAAAASGAPTGGPAGMSERQVDGLFGRLDELLRRCERIEAAMDALARGGTPAVAAVTATAVPAAVAVPAVPPNGTADAPLFDLDAVGEL